MRIAILMLAAALGAVETAPVGETTPAAADAPAIDRSASPDPTAAVVSQGAFLYRQRDLDALVLIAKRHQKAKLSRAEEDQLRRTLIGALPAREELLSALDSLPVGLEGPARDALILDLLDYQADPIPAPVVTQTAITPGADAPAAVPAAVAAVAPTPAPAEAPILVRLPELSLPRTFEGIGKRTLVMSVAFQLTDGQQSATLEAKSPVIQDAILGWLHGLTAAQFSEANQVSFKAGIEAAIREKVPEFPAGGVLIPQLEVTMGEIKGSDR